MTYDVLALQFQLGCECIKGGQARLSPDTEGETPMEAEAERETEREAEKTEREY